MDVCISQNLLNSYLHTLSAGDGWTIATHPCPPKEDALDTIDKQVLKILEDDGALFSDLSVMLNFNFSSFSIELDFLASQGGLRRGGGVIVHDLLDDSARTLGPLVKATCTAVTYSPH